MSIVSPMDSMVPHYPQTGGPPDKGLISDATGTMFAETPAPGVSIQDQVNALGVTISDIVTVLREHIYAVKYDANGGVGGPVDKTFYFMGGAAPVLKDPEPYREGYEFLGYALTSDASSTLDYVQIVKPLLPEEALSNHIITLYAVWEEIESGGGGGESGEGSGK